MFSKSKICIPLIFIVIGLFLGILFMFIMNSQYSTDDKGYIPYFKVVGDVENPVIIRNIKDYSNQLKSITYKNEKLDTIPLSLLISQAKPYTENATVLLIGTDGLTSEIDLRSIEESYIHFSSKDGWNAIHLKHPISSNIKHIKEIVVVSSDTYNDFGIHIFSENENIQNITCGQLYKSDYVAKKRFEGTSTINVEDTTNYVTVYTPQRLVPLNDFYETQVKKEIVVIFGKDGTQTMESLEGFLKINDNTISYISKTGEIELENIAGIYCGKVLSGNTDVFYDVDYYLKNNKKVMVVLLDGFSYLQYEFAKENKYIPYLASLQPANKVFSVVKPVTNAGFTSMITGKTPNIHGVHDRSVRDINGISIFGKALEYGKEACLVEGDIKILNTEIEPILNTDINKNGDIDDEVFETAKLKTLDTDLCFVHFHGIDDRGHTFGPMSKEVLEYMSKVDGYIEKLTETWDGVVVITADHGMHATETAGSHGLCRVEDMIVPYIIKNIEGVKKDE